MMEAHFFFGEIKTMCGIVGLFVGCPLSETCPAAALGDGLARLGLHTPTCFQYKSKLDDWDTHSSVRTAPARKLDHSDLKAKLLFPPELVPIAGHPALAGLGDYVNQGLVAQQLYRFLDFTAKLEHMVVNRVAMAVAHERIGISLPEPMVSDAYKLYCDEAYHAWCAYDLRKQVEKQIGIKPRLPKVPYFLERLRRLQHAYADRETQELIEVFFVIVSETLISGTLSKIPRDHRVAGAVREVVKDHADDEGRHHVFFASLLEILWPQLHERHRGLIGPLLPDLLFCFLSPDLEAVRDELTTYNVSPDTIEQIIQDTYSEEVVKASIRSSAVATLRHFERNGIFEHSGTRDAFLENGLLLGYDP